MPICTAHDLAMRIRKKYPQWVSPYKLKGGNITVILALLDRDA
ncbi:MAG: hypothetical protein V8S98_05585 [Lachnospiraceae bacterium]